MNFIVEGKPRGKARPRVFYDNRIRQMRAITPEKTKAYEKLIRWSYTAAGGQNWGDRTLEVSIGACFPIPQSFSKAKKKDAENAILRPSTKPDCDNIIKVVLDALNGVAYDDDKQVVCVSCNKFYGERGYIEINIEEVKKE